MQLGNDMVKIGIRCGREAKRRDPALPIGYAPRWRSSGLESWRINLSRPKLLLRRGVESYAIQRLTLVFRSESLRNRKNGSEINKPAREMYRENNPVCEATTRERRLSNLLPRRQIYLEKLFKLGDVMGKVSSKKC